jgi:biotin operon repressor
MLRKKIQNSGELLEGEFINKWFENRFKANKNVLIAVTGPTGSGKSYSCLRIAELWYKYHFNKEFKPETHVCFSIGEVMKLLQPNVLKPGEIIIFEEAGVNMGSLDFQNRIVKLFNYVLQSFRSKNIGIIFNLPYLDMMNKTARFLLHAYFITAGIDQKEKKSYLKGYFRQVNPKMGKIYDKYLKVSHNSRIKKIKRFCYSIPSEDISETYELKKERFVNALNSEFLREIQELDKNNLRKLARKNLSERQMDILKCLQDGLDTVKTANKLGISQAYVSRCIKEIKKKGYSIKKGMDPQNKEKYTIVEPIDIQAN